MNRFFIEKTDIEGEFARVGGEDAWHISSVLRMARGDEAVLCDAKGTDYLARVEKIEKENVLFHILSSRPCEAEPAAHVTLYQGLPKAGKLESIIQKCVELGVSRVVPVLAKRSVVRLAKKDFEKKLPRYQRVAYEAAKQCGRGIVPEVCGLVGVEEIDPAAYDAFFMPYEQEREATFKKALRAADKRGTAAVLIGPEGGFDAAEVRLLRDKGALSVTLGPRILRTETAGPAVLAMLLYEWEGDA